MADSSIVSEFKPKMTHDEFITQLREAGFTDKTVAALDEEDINSDAARQKYRQTDKQTNRQSERPLRHSKGVSKAVINDKNTAEICSVVSETNA